MVPSEGYLPLVGDSLDTAPRSPCETGALGFSLEIVASVEVATSVKVATNTEIVDEPEAMIKPHKTAQSGTPRGDFSSRPPVQIHVHEDAKTGRMTVQTDAGERELSKAESERMRCDAAVCSHGGRNTTTIPPRVRREVLARDQHRCQAPGCGRTRFLEVHHIVSRQQGGSNRAENLTTLCGSCHRLWHERGGGSVVEKPTKVA